VMRGILNDFEGIKEHYKCEAFIKILRLFEDIIREMKALIRTLRLL
jgi:hypothetical protein